jgi:hypothetical protein
MENKRYFFVSYKKNIYPFLDYCTKKINQSLGTGITNATNKD